MAAKNMCAANDVCACQPREQLELTHKTALCTYLRGEIVGVDMQNGIIFRSERHK